ncbi:MAG: ATP-dependent Zn protease [Leptolyngbya sp. DLM2.Bin15]|nr:MAG: ATP-dependent Zn protease [Leptolyngbya sp. DLM2.Bin15]
MSNTTLNIVAIAIFSIVMASLLGPLIQLSPAVPAIAAAAMLCLFTADIFAWGGRMGNLIVDGFAQFSADHRDRIVHHEAGHFLVAHVLGISVTGYTLSAWDSFRQGQPGRGGVRFDDQPLQAALQTNQLPVQFLDRYCTVWMAGAAAERLIYGDVQGGADDQDNFRILWAQLRRPTSEGNIKLRWSALRARTLLETHRTAYDALVAAMSQGASVEDCRQILDAAIDETEAIAA